MKDLLQQLLTDQTLYSSISKHWHFHTLTDIHLIKSQEQYVTDFQQSAIFNQWKNTHLREDILVTTPVYLRTYKMGKPARGMWNNGRGYIQYTNIPFKEEAAVLLHSCRMLQLLYSHYRISELLSAWVTKPIQSKLYVPVVISLRTSFH